MEECVFISDEHTDEKAPIDDPVFQGTDYSDCIPGATRISKQCDPVPCETTIPRDQPHFWKVVADFRDAFEREQSSSCQTYGVNKYFSSQSLVQGRLSIYNWTPGPRRGREDAFEKQIAGKWHIVTLQEASDYVDHDILQERFHVTHFAG